MKNSLSFVLNSLEELIQDSDDSNESSRFSKLQYEAKRVNNNLIQLLSLYKMGNTGLAANIGEYSVYDFLEECMLLEAPILESKAIKYEIDCSPSMHGYFDRSLIAGVVGNAVNNAVRYTDVFFYISAEFEGDYLAIHINDNGSGYPEGMLDIDQCDSQGVSFECGSTGLGLYFSKMVLGLHKNKKNVGYIKLENGFKLGGACFALFIP